MGASASTAVASANLCATCTDVWPKAHGVHSEATEGGQGRLAAQAAHGTGSTSDSFSESEIAMDDDWTAKYGCSNCSDVFEELVAIVERLIRSDAHSLMQGRADSTARLIMAQLAHAHGMVPARAILARRKG